MLDDKTREQIRVLAGQVREIRELIAAGTEATVKAATTNFDPALNKVDEIAKNLDLLASKK